MLAISERNLPGVQEVLESSLSRCDALVQILQLILDYPRALRNVMRGLPSRPQQLFDDGGDVSCVLDFGVSRDGRPC